VNSKEEERCPEYEIYYCCGFFAALFVSSGELFIIGCLLCVPVFEWLQRRKTPPAKWLVATARLLTRCELRRAKVVTFNEANDLRVDYVADWSAITSLLKLFLLFFFLTLFSAVNAVSLLPLFGNTTQRWTASEANLNKMHPSF
jgi:hypothetical protein